ncbi:hypothetical protein ElyMa_005986400 [Elysia marginata]|uniref:Uncharacterized protein n=1 Tax=Elysia marginata TaxID=1093978 RepID=A0AAV4GF38_9GAST|nr:hypothetical protein ElyMa_005986400 [Elysia marginata]
MGSSGQRGTGKSDDGTDQPVCRSRDYTPSCQHFPTIQSHAQSLDTAHSVQSHAPSLGQDQSVALSGRGRKALSEAADRKLSVSTSRTSRYVIRYVMPSVRPLATPG